jgi:nicotinate-nucleotide pyrophosphorylase (carboxylating)
MDKVDRLIDLALEEDLGPGDLTTEALIPADASGTARIVARESLVVAGLEVACRVFQRLDPATQWSPRLTDGQRTTDGGVVAEIAGNMAALLSAERVALNFLQRLSGIATHVRNYVDELQNAAVRLTDTRKTTPGWRVLEKYAVRVGGAHNHRMGLFDGILIKDNHIAACGGIREAVDRMRIRASHMLKIEVETTTLQEVREALAAGVEVIMLDNMDLKTIRKAITVIDGRASVEISGGVTAERLKQLAKIGVDIISVGALTHAARSVDLSMEVTDASDAT